MGLDDVENLEIIVIERESLDCEASIVFLFRLDIARSFVNRLRIARGFVNRFG